MYWNSEVNHISKKIYVLKHGLFPSANVKAMDTYNHQSAYLKSRNYRNGDGIRNLRNNLSVQTHLFDW